MQADKNPANPSQPGQPRQNRRGRFGLAIIVLLLAGVAVTGTWFLNDTNRVRDLTERTVTRLTGRSLTIRGAFDFQLGQEIRFSAKQLTWANAPWSNGPAMLSIGSAELAIDLRSILQPPLRITRVAASDTQLNFEWNEAGQSNWQLGTADSEGTEKSRQPFKWLLEEADLQNVDLQIRPAGQNDELHIHIQEVQQTQSATDLYSGQEMTVNATGISWTNPSWTSQPTLLQIAALEATFDFDSLMQTPLIITDLTARDAQLDFEWDAAGRFNWQFSAEDKEQESEHPLPLLLDKANLQNIAVRIQHSSQTEPLLINIGQATQQRDSSNRLITDIDATIDGQAIKLDGRIGPFPELLAAGNVDFDLKLDTAYSILTVQGDVANLARMKQPNVKLTWTAAEVENVFALFNIPATASGKAELQGSVTPVDEGIEGQLKGSIGEFAVSGSVHTENINQLEGLSISKLNGLTFSFQSTGPSASAAGKVLTFDGLPAEPYELDVRMQDTSAGLQIEALQFSTAGAVATGTGLLHDFPQLTRVDFDLQMNVPDIARFSDLLPGQKIPALPFTIDGKIRSNTDNLNDSVTASMKLGSMEAQLTGQLTENPRFAGSNFDWTLAVPDAQGTAGIFDLRLLQQIALSASGKATLSATDLGLQETVINLGPHTGRLNASLPLTANDETIAISGSVRGPNISALVNLVTQTDQIPALAYNLNGQYRYLNSRLTLKSLTGSLGSNQVDASGSVLFAKDWRGTSLQLSASGPRLEELVPANTLNQIPTGTFTASTALGLTASGTQLSKLSVQTQTGTVTGSLDLGWPADPDLISFDLTANGTNLRTIMPAIEGYEPAAVPYKISAGGSIRKQQADFSQLVATLGNTRIELQGNLDFGATVRSDRAVLKVSGQHLSDLGTFGAWSPPDESFNLTATLAGGVNSLNVSDFQLKYGPSDLSGSLQLQTGNRPRIDMIARSNQLDIRRFEPEEYVAASTGNAKSKRRIPDQRLPVDLLNTADGSLQLDAKKFISRRLLFEKLQVNTTLTNGKLILDGDSDFSNGGNSKITLQLQQQPGDSLYSELAITARNIRFELNQLDPTLQGTNPFQNIDAYLTGDGVNLQDIAASLNGFFWLRGGGQTIATRQFGFLFGDLLTGVLDTINPFARREPYQTIQCVAAFFEATDGVLRTAPAFLMSTERLNIGGSGTINLATERIALNVNANPRTGVGISASSLLNPFVGIRGTLADPQLSLDPTSTLIQGGAAVATGGLSLVANSLFRRWFGSREPCVTLAGEARKIQQKLNPAHVPAD